MVGFPDEGAAIQDERFAQEGASMSSAGSLARGISPLIGGSLVEPIAAYDDQSTVSRGAVRHGGV